MGALTTATDLLSLHDALPISDRSSMGQKRAWEASSPATGSGTSGTMARWAMEMVRPRGARMTPPRRSEEHTAELQSQSNLVCLLLLAKKKAFALPQSKIYDAG